MHTEDWAEGKARQVLQRHGRKFTAARAAALGGLLAGAVWSLSTDWGQPWLWFVAVYLAVRLHGSLNEVIFWSDHHQASQFVCHDDDCSHSQPQSST